MTPTTLATEYRDGSRPGPAWIADRAGALAHGSQDGGPVATSAPDGPDLVIPSREALHDG